MKEIFQQVILSKNLSKAGEIFKLSNEVVIEDIREIVTALKEVISDPVFVSNGSYQTLVDITITKITSAIRQVGSHEEHVKLLIELLDTCLSYTLVPNEKKHDPPHAKVSAELLSCMFKENYGRTDVMKLSIPTAIKFLHKGNKELSKNIATYLWLAASANAFVLAQNIQPIIDSVITGNYCLTRVLPLVYNVHPDPITDHVMVLASLLHAMDPVEQLALMELLSKVAKTKPSLLESSIPQIVDCLLTPSLICPSLQVLLSISHWKALPLAPHAFLIQEAGVKSGSVAGTCLASRLTARIGHLSVERAKSALDFIGGQLSAVDSVNSAPLLKEILGLVSAFPTLLNEKILNEVTRYSDGSCQESRHMVQQLRSLFISKKASDLTSTPSKPESYSRKLSDSFTKIPNPSVHPAPPPSYTSQSTNLPAGYVSVGGVAVPLSLIGSPSPTTPGNFGLPLGLPFANGEGGGRTRVVGSKRDASRSIPRLSAIGNAGMNRSLSRITGMHLSTSRLSPITGSSGNPGIYRSFGKLGPNGQPVGVGNGPPLTLYNPPSGGSKASRSRMGLDSSGLSAGVGSRVIEGGPMSMFGSPYTVTEATVPVARVSNTTPTLSTSGSLAAIRDERDSSFIDTAPTSLLSTYQQSENHFRSTMASQSNMAAQSVASHSVVSVLDTGPSNIRVPYENPFTAAHQMFEQDQQNFQQISETSQQDKESSEPVSIDSSMTGTVWRGVIRRKRSEQGSIARKQVRSAAPPVTLTEEPPPIQKQNSEGALNSAEANQRISVFEPLNMRDTVQHFCEKHLDKIKAYMERVSARIPLPVKCTIQERKSKKYVRIHFVCHKKGDCCLYSNNFFVFETKHPRLWIHLMFLNLQARSESALSTRDVSVSALKTCWDILKHDNKPFVTLVMSAFPSTKDQDHLIDELRTYRFFDVFEYNGIAHHWGCFLCNHPDRAANFLLQQGTPVIEGQLKEKKSKWLVFRRWRTKHFTLSGSNLSCREQKPGEQSSRIEVHEIRSVKVTRSGRSIPKAFEIFTGEKSFTLKAKDKKDAEQWVQCLSIAVASAQARTETCYKTLPSHNVVSPVTMQSYNSLRTVV